MFENRSTTGRRPTIPWIMTRSGVRCQRRRRSSRAKKSGRLSGPSASGITEGDPTRPEASPARARTQPGIDFAASRRPTRYEFRRSPHQVPLLLRPLEHQHRRRPVRTAGPQGDGIRPQAQGIQGARLRRRAVPRRRHRAGRPRLAEHAQGRRRGQEDPRRRGAVRRDHRPPALGRSPHDRRRLHLEQPRRPQVRHRPRQAVRRHRPRGRLQELRALAGPRGHATSARPRTPRRPSAGSSTPGTPSSSTTRTSASSARPSPTSRWTRPICRRSAT